MGNDNSWAFIVVTLAREFGWSLAEIEELSPKQIKILLEEVARQKAVENYNENYRMAFLSSTMINLWSKTKVRPEDMVGEDAFTPVEKESPEQRLERAKAMGLRLKERDGRKTE